MKFIQSDYKTIQLSLYMIECDDVLKRAYRFLLPKVLVANTETIKTKQKMIEHLQMLYGAGLGGRTSLVGNLNVMQISFQMVNPKIVNEEELADHMITLFEDMILDRSSFNDAIFEMEKRLLIEQWESITDNKHFYANVEFAKHFFDNHRFGYPISGYKEDIEKITCDDLYAYFKACLNTNKIYFIVNGYINGYQEKIASSFRKIERLIDIPLKLEHLEDYEPKVIESKIEMNQALIKIGYHLPIFRHHPLYHAVLCFDLILGAYAESILFKEIREKQGLCYDIRSTFDPTQGVLVISSGVDQKRKQQAVDGIMHIMDNLSDYGFNEEALMHAKQYMIHQIKSSYDEQIALSIRAFFDDLYGDIKTLEQRIKAIESVTYEEVLKVIDHLSLQTTYVLSGE